MTSIKDYYNTNVISNIDRFDNWDLFVYSYGLMVANPGNNDIYNDDVHGECFRNMRSSIRMYPDFRHSIYTLNVFRHFVGRDITADTMVEDMLWNIVGNGCHDLREDKFIEELLDILDYLEYMEMNVSIEEIMDTCAWNACEDIDQSKTFNRFLKLSEERGMTLRDHAHYIQLYEG